MKGQGELQKVSQEVKHIHKVEPSRELVNELKLIHKKLDGISFVNAKIAENVQQMTESLLELSITIMKRI